MEILQKEIPVQQFLQECVNIPLFQECCHACPNHGRTWSCPPFSFKPEELWANYDTVLLQCRVIDVPEALQQTTFTAEEMNRASKELLRRDKKSMLLEMLEQEKTFPGSMALSAGSCDICPEGTCTRLQEDPCRNPGMMRYSVEALGGDVGKALKLYFAKEILWGKDGHMPPYYILLGGLLKKSDRTINAKEMGYRVW